MMGVRPLSSGGKVDIGRVVEERGPFRPARATPKRRRSGLGRGISQEFANI
jgi:hypothetical protein